MILNYTGENMKKIIFLEGLPGVGKSTIAKTIKNNYPDINVVDEIISGQMPNYQEQNQEWFMKNDDKKISLYNQGIIVIDRGPISTLSYNQTRLITDKNYSFDITKVVKWFESYHRLLTDPNTYVYYLTNKKQSYYISIEHKDDPYGSIKNQQLLEDISIYNSQKYATNLKIIEYHKQNKEEIINEIIN